MLDGQQHQQIPAALPQQKEDKFGTKTGDTRAGAENSTRARTNKRAPFKSWQLPTVRHELLLLGELFVICCAIFVLHTVIMLPWDHIARLSSLTYHPVGRIEENILARTNPTSTQNAGQMSTNAPRLDSAEIIKIVESYKNLKESMSKVPGDGKTIEFTIVRCK